MTIAPIINVEREKMGAMGILLVIGDGVYVFVCTVYSSVFKEYTQHAFIYDSHFSTLDNSEVCGSMIYNRLYAPIRVLEEKDRKSKATLENTLSKFSDGNCIVKYEFKVTANYFS